MAEVCGRRGQGGKVQYGSRRFAARLETLTAQVFISKWEDDRSVGRLGPLSSTVFTVFVYSRKIITINRHCFGIGCQPRAVQSWLRCDSLLGEQRIARKQR
jgi:hypothetical protein